MVKTSPTPDELPFSLARLALSFRRFNDQTLRAVGLHGLAPGLASVLHALEGLGKCTTGELVEATQFPNGTLTGLVDTLEEQKLVARLPNPKDGRSWLLTLTTKGLKVCVKLRERHHLSLALFEKTLGDRESVQLIRLLDKASEAMRDYKAPLQAERRTQRKATRRKPSAKQIR